MRQLVLRTDSWGTLESYFPVLRVRPAHLFIDTEGRTLLLPNPCYGLLFRLPVTVLTYLYINSYFHNRLFANIQR